MLRGCVSASEDLLTWRRLGRIDGFGASKELVGGVVYL